MNRLLPGRCFLETLQHNICLGIIHWAGQPANIETIGDGAADPKLDRLPSRKALLGVGVKTWERQRLVRRVRPDGNGF